MEKKYKIEELCTSGWSQTNDEDTNLNREQATKKAQQLIDEGYNPNRLRIVPVWIATWFSTLSTKKL
jgi:hypothetical protein